jgi:7-carboxy-7-deazaguanine synthase
VTYRITEIFYSVQGEGYWSGRPAVFVRFSGCNLWTGREADRARSICTFCDTDFTPGAEMTAEDILACATALWPGPENSSGEPMVIFTGGEPLLQLDYLLADTFHGWYVAVETNGTVPITVPVDWVCVSPKTPTVRIQAGDELKLVYPQTRAQPDDFAGLEFTHRWISPRNDGDQLNRDHAQAAYSYVLNNPQWRLATQTHKVIGVR